MRKLRKCDICGNSYNALWAHLKQKHNITNDKEYYDKYLRKEGEGFCIKCGKPTTYRSFSKGYLKYCSLKCSNNDEKVKKIKNKLVKSDMVMKIIVILMLLEILGCHYMDNLIVKNLLKKLNYQNH